MKIVWTEPSRQDLREIFAYIAEENPRAATAFLTEIKRRVEGTRELVLSGTHYLLPYRVKKQQIQILAVFHTSKKWSGNIENDT